MQVEEKGWFWSISENEEYFAVAGEELVVYNADGLGNRRRVALPGDRREIRRISFLPGERSLVGVCYFSGLCDIVNVETHEVVSTLEGAESEVKSISFNGKGRAAFSTREGAIWIWKQDDLGVWELEELIEYSEEDVKKVFWTHEALLSLGYSGEIVSYSLWEDEMCGIKWEIEEILKEESTVWDGEIIYNRTQPNPYSLDIPYNNSENEKSPNESILHIAHLDASVSAEEEDQTLSFMYFGVVTQKGVFSIYRRNKDTQWKSWKSIQASKYPIISITTCYYENEWMFAFIGERSKIMIYNANGEKRKEETVLSPYDEPMAIEAMHKKRQIYVLSTSCRRGERSSKVTTVSI
ncbi:hypothetical protein NEFER01_0561 [Nematocida sp. LUAm1]|nr:hypothetical protein NEFER01_0561 [Nematocida sp. LUAm1]